ncbi:MAG: ERAP1-like C-terminal domain-containing protein, partial [Burkholderiales bacterium]|nr:ERAP1-like C-terminal domain-containing protein [Burkholderiales bacterium]
MIAPVEAAARAAAEVPALEPGVSRELARWRAARLRDIRYALWIDLSADGPALDARLEIRFNLDARTDLVLDWRAPSPRHPAQMPEAISANGRALAGARMVSEHLVIPARALRRGANRLSMRVRSPVAAAGTAVTRFVDREDGAHYLYTLLVPAEASTLFPCFDQPDLKARLRLTLTAPAGWRAVSNAPLARSSASLGRVRLRFGETEPLSTYQFAFAAGPFEELIESAAPRAAAPGPVRLYVRRSKIEAARREAPDLLRLNREALGWYTRYFARAFPFAKYDLVLVPELAYGGMEHSGATFLREESVLFPFEPAATDRLRRAQLVLHETAHQWFGDLVTMRWFDDLWLKEGFANFMAAKAGAELVRRRVPEIHPWVAFGALKLAAYRTDATPGTTPIWRELGNLADAKSAYGAIVYSKAPAVLRQAEYYVGERAFRRALRAFLSRHAHGVADWSDLVAALEKASGRPLAAWAEAWVKRRGMARVRLERGADAISLTQENLLGEAQLWPMRLKLVALAGGRHSVHPLRLAGARTDLGLAGAAGADFLFANFEDYGYGQFLLDPQSLEYALAHPEALQDELLRAQVFDSLWESVREAQLDPRRYIELALAWLPRERDDTTATLLLARLSSAYLRYSGAQAQRAFAPAVEALLLSGLSGSGSASRRIAYLRALVETARSSA